jgi:parallel beta-helix repeat protein
MNIKKLSFGTIAIGLGLAFSLSGAQASHLRPPLVNPRTGQAPLNTYVVTKTSDSGDNTNPGTGTLRRALVDANNHSGFDAIVFDIPGSGVKTITVKNYFPDISDNAGVLIDGTQSDDRIEIDGSQVSNHHGLPIISDNNVIKGLIINGVQDGGAAIALMNGASNNVIIGNYLGTNAAGNGSDANHSGIFITNNSNNNYIGGTDGVTPGGPCTGDCNVLSGNRFHGIVIDHSNGNVIQGNFIGVNANGTGAVPNSDTGILVAYSANNTIGGTSPQARNVIAGNHAPNIEVGGNLAHNNTVQGNYIGTNSAGTAGVPGADNGVLIDMDAHDNLVDSNLVSSNGRDGILVFKGANKTTITNNRVGISASSDANLGNSTKGIELQGSNNWIANNRVAFNGGDGIRVKSGVNNGVRYNVMFSNSGFGINLGSDAWTPNDSGDGDGGANNLQNYPSLSKATFDGTNVTIQGSLNSRPNSRYDLDFYWNPSCDVNFDHSGGEGKQYLGATTVTTDGGGNVSFSVPFGNVPSSGVISADATDSSRNTSELSACATITAGSPSLLPPQLLTPSNGESVGSNPPFMDWTDVSGATRYVFSLRQDAKRGPIIVMDKNVPVSQYNPPTLATGHTYYWFARACNDGGCKKSQVFSFSLP